MHRTGRLAGVRLSCAVTLLAILAGCGGGGDDSPASAPASVAPGVGSNGAPTIQGQPGTTVLVGQSYSFQPVASDPNSDALSFSATNLPSWLTLNATTGRITGTPTAADVATVAGITITVSDGRTTTALGPFTITVTANGSGTALLTWVPPASNTDGTPLVDLAGYQILYGPSANELTGSISVTNPSLSSYMVENLTAGTWYFAVVAINATGGSSSPSGVASKTIT
jgi:hypothetical protein